ncbi:MAG: TraB/GumN family protein [Oscillospiraceae bacterium]|nr:TraB/GumN family protein [Oscillospiraceae bacterium]
MRAKKSRAAICLLLCLILAITACQSPAPEPDPFPLPDDLESPEPADEILTPMHTDFLWEVLGGQGRVYLMGTMHIVRDDYVFTPALLDIFDEMDALALEVDMLDISLLSGLMDLYSYPEGETILDHLSERGAAHLLNMIDVYGLDRSILHSRPFALSSAFMVAAFEGTHFRPIVGGVDLMLNLRAWELGMTIHSLEDSRAVLENMNNLPADTQERIMVLTIPTPDQMLEDFFALYDVFLSGDYQRVLDFLYPEEWEEDDAIGGDGLPIEFTDDDDLYLYYMLEHRDNLMTDKIISFLESGENVFVAAGLAHFVGEGSIIYLLEEAGYQVVRVDLTQSRGQVFAA